MKKRTGSESGQSLIQLALMLALLIGFAALAIDIGNGYLASRRMQNAADAAVLAGARELCMGNPTTIAINKARDYLLRNGVKAELIDAADITVSNGVIRVKADYSGPTWLARIFGAQQMDVSADAAATCGRATSACGLWPISFELALWANVPCGERLVIWDADKDNVNSTCKINGQPRPTCDCYDCDLNKDGVDDFVLMTEVSRGWLDFSDNVDPLYRDPCASNGCGAAELKCRLADDSGNLVKLPACIPGIRGVKAGARSAVDSRSGQVVAIPLFTSVNCPSGSHCSGTSADTFYIERFGCILVEGWDHSFELRPKPEMDPREYKRIKSKVIYVRKNCGDTCITFCGTTDGTQAEAWELTAVGLVK